MIKDIDLRDRVEPIIRAAGEIPLSYFSQARSLSRREKPGAGFVTKADIESEKFLMEHLSTVLPEADFYAEESGISGNGDYRWVIDPLDGTTNFAHGLPHFCLSVALTYQRKTVFGMVYQPVLNELFWAQTGKGAWLNGEKIAVSTIDTLKSGLLVVGSPYLTKGIYQDFLKQVCTVAPHAYAFRYCGAIALDLAYVACGRFDGVFFHGLPWWDFAAADLLIREAGGKTSDFEGNMIDLHSQSFIGGGAAVYQSLLKMLRN